VFDVPGSVGVYGRRPMPNSHRGSGPTTAILGCRSASRCERKCSLESTLKASLATDRRLCWAGRGIYGLFRHGLLPGVRDLARVGGIYLHASDRELRLEELEFVLKFIGYRFQQQSLRNALWRGLYLGIHANETWDSWSGSRESERRQREAARAVGMTRVPLFRAIIERASTQVETALAERTRRRDAHWDEYLRGLGLDVRGFGLDGAE
jgi:hypothetical protein